MSIMRIMMMIMAIYLNSLMMMVLVMMASVPKYISSKMLPIVMVMMMVVVVEVEIHVGKFWQIQETGKSPRGSLRPKNGVERFSAGSDWL